MLTKFYEWLNEDWDMKHHAYMLLGLLLLILLCFVCLSSCGLLVGKNPSFSIWRSDKEPVEACGQPTQPNTALEGQEEPQMPQQ